MLSTPTPPPVKLRKTVVNQPVGPIPLPRAKQTPRVPWTSNPTTSSGQITDKPAVTVVPAPDTNAELIRIMMDQMAFQREQLELQRDLHREDALQRREEQRDANRVIMDQIALMAQGPQLQARPIPSVTVPTVQLPPSVSTQAAIKMELLKDTHQDVREWFERYELNARAQFWTEITKAVRLPTHLEGKALLFWKSQAGDIKDNYAAMKTFLMGKLGSCDDAVARVRKFWCLKQGLDQSAVEFALEVMSEGRCIGIPDGQMVKKFLEDCHPMISTLVDARRPQSMDEVVTEASRVEARMPMNTENVIHAIAEQKPVNIEPVQQANTAGNKKRSAEKVSNDNSNRRANSRSPVNNNRRRTDDRDSRLNQNTSYRPRRTNNSGDNIARGSNNNNRRSNSERGTCYICGDPNHWARSCPHRQPNRNEQIGSFANRNGPSYNPYRVDYRPNYQYNQGNARQSQNLPINPVNNTGRPLRSQSANAPRPVVNPARPNVKSNLNSAGRP